MEAEHIDVVTGTTDWQTGGDHYGVDKIICHEEYHNGSYANDVALLKLKTDIHFYDKVQPIKYSARVVPPRRTLKVSGWGLLWASILIIL